MEAGLALCVCPAALPGVGGVGGVGRGKGVGKRYGQGSSELRLPFQVPVSPGRAPLSSR